MDFFINFKKSLLSIVFMIYIDLYIWYIIYYILYIFIEYYIDYYIFYRIFKLKKFFLIIFNITINIFFHQLNTFNWIENCKFVKYV